MPTLRNIAGYASLLLAILLLVGCPFLVGATPPTEYSIDVHQGWHSDWSTYTSSPPPKVLKRHLLDLVLAISERAEATRFGGAIPVWQEVVSGTYDTLTPINRQPPDYDLSGGSSVLGFRYLVDPVAFYGYDRRHELDGSSPPEWRVTEYPYIISYADTAFQTPYDIETRLAIGGSPQYTYEVLGDDYRDNIFGADDGDVLWNIPLPDTIIQADDGGSNPDTANLLYIRNSSLHRDSREALVAAIEDLLEHYADHTQAVGGTFPASTMSTEWVWVPTHSTATAYKAWLLDPTSTEFYDEPNNKRYSSALYTGRPDYDDFGTDINDPGYYDDSGYWTEMPPYSNAEVPRWTKKTLWEAAGLPVARRPQWEILDTDTDEYGYEAGNNTVYETTTPAGTRRSIDTEYSMGVHVHTYEDPLIAEWLLNDALPHSIELVGSWGTEADPDAYTGTVLTFDGDPTSALLADYSNGSLKVRLGGRLAILQGTRSTANAYLGGTLAGYSGRPYEIPFYVSPSYTGALTHMGTVRVKSRYSLWTLLREGNLDRDNGYNFVDYQDYEEVAAEVIARDELTAGFSFTLRTTEALPSIDGTGSYDIRSNTAGRLFEFSKSGTWGMTTTNGDLTDNPGYYTHWTGPDACVFVARTLDSTAYPTEHGKVWNMEDDGTPSVGYANYIPGTTVRLYWPGTYEARADYPIHYFNWTTLRELYTLVNLLQWPVLEDSDIVGANMPAVEVKTTTADTSLTVPGWATEPSDVEALILAREENYVTYNLCTGSDGGHTFQPITLSSGTVQRWNDPTWRVYGNNSSEWVAYTTRSRRYDVKDSTCDWDDKVYAEGASTTGFPGDAELVVDHAVSSQVTVYSTPHLDGVTTFDVYGVARDNTVGTADEWAFLTHPSRLWGCQDFGKSVIAGATVTGDGTCDAELTLNYSDISYTFSGGTLDYIYGYHRNPSKLGEGTITHASSPYGTATINHTTIPASLTQVFTMSYSETYTEYCEDYPGDPNYSEFDFLEERTYTLYDYPVYQGSLDIFEAVLKPQFSYATP